MHYMPSVKGISVRTPDEMDEKLVEEVVAEVVLTSDESIRQELDEFYAERPDLFAEHLLKQAAVKAREVVETAKRLGLTETAAVKFIARGLRS